MHVHSQVKVKARTNPNVKWVNDLKQLSGGERSYTTVSFLLAMGQHTESPFRCLDEFDVSAHCLSSRLPRDSLGAVLCCKAACILAPVPYGSVWPGLRRRTWIWSVREPGGLHGLA